MAMGTTRCRGVRRIDTVEATLTIDFSLGPEEMLMPIWLVTTLGAVAGPVALLALPAGGCSVVDRHHPS